MFIFFYFLSNYNVYYLSIINICIYILIGVGMRRGGLPVSGFCLSPICPQNVVTAGLKLQPNVHKLTRSSVFPL